MVNGRGLSIAACSQVAQSTYLYLSAGSGGRGLYIIWKQYSALINTIYGTCRCVAYVLPYHMVSCHLWSSEPNYLSESNHFYVYTV